VPVTLAIAAEKDVPIQLQAIGAARAYASVSVKARVDGQLAQVAFKQGDEVQKGGLIFQIDPSHGAPMTLPGSLERALE